MRIIKLEVVLHIRFVHHFPSSFRVLVNQSHHVIRSVRLCLSVEAGEQQQMPSDSGILTLVLNGKRVETTFRKQSSFHLQLQKRF
jgi:hypothetical protein